MIRPTQPGLGVVATDGVFTQAAASIESWARRSPFWALGAVALLFALNLKRT